MSEALRHRGERRRARGGLAAALTASLVLSGAVAARAGATDRVYWGEYGSTTPHISYAATDGSSAGNVPTGTATVSEPYGLAIDAAAGLIYWANDSGNAISVADLGGGGGHDLDTTGATLDNPEGVAIDPITGRIYWADRSANKISYAAAGGGSGHDLNTTGATVSGPDGVAIDPAAGRIYWGNDTANKISYANLDGSGGHDLTVTGATVDNPAGLAIDRITGRVYWVNNGNNTISYANLDGSGGHDLTVTGVTVSSPDGIAVDPDAGRLYWGNYGANKISYANLDGSDAHDVSTPGLTPDGPAFPVVLDAPQGLGAPQIAGGSTTGSTLNCVGATWAGDMVEAFLYRAPQTLSYRWSRDGADIPGANQATLVAQTAGSYTCAAVAANAAGSTAQTSRADVVRAPVVPTRPSLSAVRAIPSLFAVGRSSTPVTGVAARRHHRGTVFSFRLDQAARVRIRILRSAPGRRDGGRCRRPTRRLRHSRRCTRTITLATLTRTGHAGTDRVAFSGRIHRRALAPGLYRVSFTAIGAAGASPQRKITIRIVRR